MLKWHKDTVKMNWFNAVAYCENLGKGWRLPSRIELLELYDSGKHKDLNFEEDRYWSITTYDFNPGGAWSVAFYHGSDLSCYDKSNEYYVRAVRAA